MAIARGWLLLTPIIVIVRAAVAPPTLAGTAADTWPPRSTSSGRPLPPLLELFANGTQIALEIVVVCVVRGRREEHESERATPFLEEDECWFYARDE